MRVKELIEILKEFSPEAPVFIVNNNNTEIEHSIKKIRKMFLNGIEEIVEIHF